MKLFKDIIMRITNDKAELEAKAEAELEAEAEAKAKAKLEAKAKAELEAEAEAKIEIDTVEMIAQLENRELEENPSLTEREIIDPYINKPTYKDINILSDKEQQDISKLESDTITLIHENITEEDFNIILANIILGNLYIDLIKEKIVAIHDSKFSDNIQVKKNYDDVMAEFDKN